MASCGNQHFCTLCLEDDISNEAVTWCTDCETFLWFNCERHHKRIKASKEHRIVSMEQYDNLLSFILKTSNHCADHDKRYELYCSFHENACCVQCINKNHKECRDLPLLADVLGNITSSPTMFHLERDINVIKESFEEIEKTISSQGFRLEQQKENGVREIKKFRTLINEHLDKIEKELLDKLSTVYSKSKSNIDGLIKEVKRRKKRVDCLEQDFVKMKTFATDLQTFIGSKTINEMKMEETIYIEELQSIGKLNTIYLEVKMSPALNSITTDISSFGDISVRSTKASFELKTDTKFHQQIPIMKVEDITQKKTKFKTTIKMPKKSKMNIITGCQILPDGQMLFVDRDNMCLMLFSRDGDYIRDVVTFNVCYIADNIVAVTLCNEERVKFFPYQ